LQITFLGTSSGVPTRSRNVSSIALRLPQRAEVWLFDCGEGTQHQLLRSDVKISQIRRIFVTHLHGDHIFGLMGLLASCGMAGNPSRIDLYGPPGLDKYIEACTRYSQTHFSYPLRVHTVQPGLLYEDNEFTVSSGLLHHRVTAFGYRIAEKDRPGHFDAKKAADLGIPSGPLYGKLKRGEQIVLPDGRKIDGADFCAPPELGRKIAYCTDTIFCDGAIALAQDADVVIHEATFAHQDAEMAYQRLHSTSTMAAQVALAASAKLLLMTHFSPRYAPGNALQLDDLLQEARSIFPNTELAYDFFSYEVPRHRTVDDAIHLKRQVNALKN
jgi:ribonuclease Z